MRHRHSMHTAVLGSIHERTRVQLLQCRQQSSWFSAESTAVKDVGGTHLNVDEHAVVCLVQDFAALHVQRKLKGNLSLAAGELSWLQHINGAVDNLDRLSRQSSFRHQPISAHCLSLCSPTSTRHKELLPLLCPGSTMLGPGTHSKLLLLLSLHNNGSFLYICFLLRVTSSECVCLLVCGM